MRPNCSACGSQPDEGDDIPLGWSVGVERGRRVLTCPECTRSNARSIEARLDSDWW